MREKEKNAGNQHFSPFPANVFNPLPDDKILDQSKLKQIADENLKCI